MIISLVWNMDKKKGSIYTCPSNAIRPLIVAGEINLCQFKREALIHHQDVICGVVKKVYGLKYTAYGLDKPYTLYHMP